MPRYVDVDALLKQIAIDSKGIEGSYGDKWQFMDTIEAMPFVTINDHPEEIKVTNCNYNQFADDSKKVSSSWGHENDLISRADALSCFHDWIDSHGDVHTADEMPEYQRIEQLPSAQPEIIHCRECKHWREGDAYSYCDKLFSMGVLDVYDYMTSEDDFCSNAERRTDAETEV